MNKAILMGRLTKDPVMTVTESGVAVVRFTAAVSRRFKKDEADFINIVTFNKTAEFVNKYFTKGQGIALSGSIQTRSWEGQDGKRNYATEVIADEINFVGSKKDNPTPSETAESNSTFNEFVPVNDDDLPF